MKGFETLEANNHEPAAKPCLQWEDGTGDESLVVGWRVNPPLSHLAAVAPVLCGWGWVAPYSRCCDMACRMASIMMEGQVGQI